MDPKDRGILCDLLMDLIDVQRTVVLMAAKPPSLQSGLLGLIIERNGAQMKILNFVSDLVSGGKGETENGKRNI